MSDDKLNENAEEPEMNIKPENLNQENDEGALQSNDRIKELEMIVSQWQDKYLRKVAEFENYKKRTENDQLNLIKYAAENFITKLLTIVDDFDRSLNHLKDAKDLTTIEEGIRLVYSKLLKTLDDQGVKKIEAVGQPFDVHLHEAVMQMQNDTVPPHTILEEVQAGYIYKDKVIRHSKVIVSDETSSSEKE